MVGTAGNDTHTGTAFSDTLSGLGGDDDLSGGAGADTLDGGDGNDTLSGDDGDDLLYGGAGNNSLQGGDGGDSYYYDGTGTNDVISDTSGVDVLQFEDFDALAEVDTVARTGDDLVFSLTGGRTLTVQDFYNGNEIETLEYDGTSYALDTTWTDGQSADNLTDFLTPAAVATEGRRRSARRRRQR